MKKQNLYPVGIINLEEVIGSKNAEIVVDLIVSESTKFAGNKQDRRVVIIEDAVGLIDCADIENDVFSWGDAGLAFVINKEKLFDGTESTTTEAIWFYIRKEWDLESLANELGRTKILNYSPN